MRSGKISQKEMDRKLRYHPLFNSDVAAAADWYDARSPGLGDAFATTVRNTVGEALSDPKRHSLEDMVAYSRCNYADSPATFTEATSGLI